MLDSTQRIRDRQDDSDRLPLSMHLTDSCERRNSVSKCTPEWDEKLSFLATFRLRSTRLDYRLHVMYDSPQLKMRLFRPTPVAF